MNEKVELNDFLYDIVSYVEMNPDVNVSAFNRDIHQFIQKNAIDEEERQYIAFQLQKMAEIEVYNNLSLPVDINETTLTEFANHVKLWLDIYKKCKLISVQITTYDKWNKYMEE